MSTRNAVNAVHKVRHVNVPGNKNRAQNQPQNVRALHRRKAYAHQKTNNQLQARTTHNAHAANILQPAQGKSTQNRRGNRHRQLQRLRRTVRPAEQSSNAKRRKSRRSSRQTHTAVGRSGMRRTLIRNIHHVVAMQNRAHRKRQKGTQSKSKSKNTQQLRKGGHTSSKALAPLPWIQTPESRLRDDMCVVCVYFVFYKTLLKPGTAYRRISNARYTPSPERKREKHRIPHLPRKCSIRCHSIWIRTSVHPPKYADPGHVPGHDAHSRCAPDSSESTAHNRAHQGQVPEHSTGKYTDSPH